ncbi:MAG: OmpA/MotB protein, partial [Sphingomonas bacterium]|nr:OmpA/MotB protein [Sphingomonas bacterium]
MRRLVFLAAVAPLAMASPAMARDGAWYVGGHVGTSIVEDLKYDLTGPRRSANNGIVVDSRYGIDSDGVIGYDFGGFRVEVEGGYKRAEVKSIDLVGGAFCANVACRPVGTQAGGRYKGFGNTQVYSAMINGMLDFGPDDGIQGFVGGGVGGARVKAGINRTSNQVLLLDDRDTRFAWQAIAGVRAPLTSRFDVSLKYRFFNVEDVRFTAGNGDRADTRYRSHSLLAGISYN